MKIQLWSFFLVWKNYSRCIVLISIYKYRACLLWQIIKHCKIFDATWAVTDYFTYIKYQNTSKWQYVLYVGGFEIVQHDKGTRTTKSFYNYYTTKNKAHISITLVQCFHIFVLFFTFSQLTVQLCYNDRVCKHLTIRLRARGFYEVIVDQGEARINYHLVEIESE
jgi:hypothetical protein